MDNNYSPHRYSNARPVSKTPVYYSQQAVKKEEIISTSPLPSHIHTSIPKTIENDMDIQQKEGDNEQDMDTERDNNIINNNNIISNKVNTTQRQFEIKLPKIIENNTTPIIKLFTDSHKTEEEEEEEEEGEYKPLANLLDDAQLYFSQKNNTLYVDINNRNIFSGFPRRTSSPLSSASSTSLSLSLSSSAPVSFESKLNLSSPTRTPSQLLAYLHQTPSSPIPISPPPPNLSSSSPPSLSSSFSTPMPLLFSSSSSNFSSFSSSFSSSPPSFSSSPQQSPRNNNNGHNTIINNNSNNNNAIINNSNCNNKPKRANDYTGEFKREFCMLLGKNPEARATWEHFWRRRECTGRRPCIKSYLAFCDLPMITKTGERVRERDRELNVRFEEFGRLKRSHKFRVLGTRTNCECGYPPSSSSSSSSCSSSSYSSSASNSSTSPSSISTSLPFSSSHPSSFSSSSSFSTPSKSAFFTMTGSADGSRFHPYW